MKPLQEHILEAQSALEQVERAIDGKSLSAPLMDHIRGLASRRSALSQASSLISARSAARAALARLDGSVDGDGKVELWGAPVAFADARMLLVQAYLSVSWSLVDMLTATVGRFVCIETVGKNEMKPAKMWEHFVKDGKSLPTDLSGVLSHAYGLPVAVSYALRNHFVHDGGQYDDRTFFDGVGVTFKVSDEGWQFLERKIFNEYRVGAGDSLAAEVWPWPQDDLRKVLAICEREVDAATALVLVHATQSFKLQVGVMLDR